MKNIFISSKKELEDWYRQFIFSKEYNDYSDDYFVINYNKDGKTVEDIICFVDNDGLYEKHVHYLVHDYANDKDILDVLNRNYPNLYDYDYLLSEAKTCVRENKWYELFYQAEEKPFLPDQYEIVERKSSSECLDYLLTKEKTKKTEYEENRKNAKLEDWISFLIKNGPKDTFDKIILDSYTLKIFADGKKDKKWFKENFEGSYPKYIKDINSKMKNELKSATKIRKKDQIFKQKQKKQRYEKGYADVDVWNFYNWFIETASPMLKELAKKHYGHPMIDENGNFFESQDYEGNVDTDKAEKKWTEILNRMAFLLDEMNEDKCSMKNPYTDEWYSVCEKFWNKYGHMGEKLKSEEQLKEEKEKGSSVMYWPDKDPNPDNVAAYNELSNKMHEFDKKIYEYREECKKEFFKLFEKYFWALWD